jgi:hypothetical protein
MIHVFNFCFHNVVTTIYDVGIEEYQPLLKDANYIDTFFKERFKNKAKVTTIQFAFWENRMHWHKDYVKELLVSYLKVKDLVKDTDYLILIMHGEGGYYTINDNQNGYKISTGSQDKDYITGEELFELLQPFLEICPAALIVNSCFADSRIIAKKLIENIENPNYFQPFSADFLIEGQDDALKYAIHDYVRGKFHGTESFLYNLINTENQQEGTNIQTETYKTTYNNLKPLLVFGLTSKTATMSNSNVYANTYGFAALKGILETNLKFTVKELFENLKYIINNKKRGDYIPNMQIIASNDKEAKKILDFEIPIL